MKLPRGTRLKASLKRVVNNRQGYICDLQLRLNGAYRNKQSVSFCTGVKNRLEHLQQTVLKNLEDNQHYPLLEIVILNYNCPDPNTEKWVKSELAEFIKSGRVSYYRLPDITTYKFAHAKNLAFNLAKGDILCNVDADNFVGQGFANYVSAQLSDGNSYIAGPRDGRGLGGRVAIKREHFELTGGYDERIIDWGGDDVEFTSRLDRLGLKRRQVHNERFLGSIKHSDDLRTLYSEYRDKWLTAELSTQYMEQNQADLILKPNGHSYGHGTVQRNFSEWVTV